MSLANHKVMGVINLTPDSFSDGGLHNDQNFTHYFNFLVANNVKFLDLGAESTAPFNSAVSWEEEMQRFEKSFFQEFENLHINDELSLSIDTYKFQVFKEVYQFLMNRGFRGKIIWNDVSGVYNDGLFEFLKVVTPKADYVYCHTTTQLRASSGEHMDKLFCFDSSNVVEQVKAYFNDFLVLAKQEQLLDRVILDPCFGFSKSKQQNYDLLKNIGSVFEDISDIPLLFGVSRKSFLKALIKDPSNEQLNNQLDILTSHLVKHFYSKYQKRSVLHRLHNTYIFSSLEKISKVLD